GDAMLVADAAISAPGAAMLVADVATSAPGDTMLLASNMLLPASGVKSKVDRPSCPVRVGLAEDWKFVGSAPTISSFRNPCGLMSVAFANIPSSASLRVGKAFSPMIA